MEDEAILAYEHEFDEEAEWEAMHAHEMEAAEEEMRMMDDTTNELQEQEQEHHSPAPPVALPTARQSSAATSDHSSALSTREKLDAVLERCATLLGNDSATQMASTSQLSTASGLPHDFSLASDAGFLEKRPPIDADSMPIILSDGGRFFVRKKDNSESQQFCQNLLKFNTSTLLSAPMDQMMQQIEQRQIESAMQMETQNEESPVLLSQHAHWNGALWLDKYRPERFIDLLSDERTNREVLAWVKSWDPFVFANKKATAAKVSKQDEEQVDLRPEVKIILLCGPPGAGKTTLATIVAKHCGYNPIEVNASDDRTAAVLRNKIINAMEMQSICGDRKPNCIILDEIDGAMNGDDGKSAIAAIEQVVMTPWRGGNKSKKHKSEHPLTRPLICICNDQYASVLRPLRKMARVFVLNTPNQQRLITRLKYICRQESVKVSSAVLASLCKQGDNDIRYCLNTLQTQRFSGDQLTLTDGRKDISRDIHVLLDQVFFRSKSKTIAQSFGQVYEAAHAMGNSSLVLNALHENLPQMIFNDPTMSKICQTLEWIGFADACDTRVRADQQFILSPYAHFASVVVHQACCTSSRRKTSYPFGHMEHQRQLNKSRNILQSLVDESRLTPSLRGHSVGLLATNVVPWMVAILNPSIRRASANVQSVAERAMVTRLIELMSSLGIVFSQKSLPDGNEDFVMEPALHELVRYSGLEGYLHQQLPLSVRKMIAREVDLENLRHAEAQMSHRMYQPGSKQATQATTHATLPAGSTDKNQPAADPVAAVLKARSDEQLAQEEAKRRKRNPFAYSYQENKRLREEQTEAAQPTKLRKSLVRFKYNEGYTCGIKSPVYIRDLL